MSRNGWEKSKADLKQESFFAPERAKSQKKKKKEGKPFMVETRLKKTTHKIFEFLLEWSGKRKFETLELAQAYVKKLEREAGADWRERRIVNTETGEVHAMD